MKVIVGRREIEVHQTIADRVVGWFNPSAGVERLRSRMMLSAAAGGYQGGRRDRRNTRNWRPPEGSANADTLLDLPDLRARSRDLVRNMPIATGAIGTTVTNVVGEGLTVAPSIDRTLLGLSDEQAEEWEATAAKEFALACGTADFTRVQSFEEMQVLALRAVLESGDVFAVRRYRKDPGQAYGTKLLLVEADRVSNPGRIADRPGMIGGVAFDGDGVPFGYSISDRHPGDMLFNAAAIAWRTAPARDADGRTLVLHLYERLRPDLARGVPMLAPVIEVLKTLGDYSENEATAASVAAMFTVFLTSEQSEGEPSTFGEPVPGSPDEIELGKGAIVDLAPGEKPEFANPMRPNAQFDAFITALSRWIGVALEIPYEVLLKHFTSSYSASRAALETAWQFFRRRRRWLARRFCQPYYEWIIYEAVATGRLAAPGFFDDPLIRQAWCGASWYGPARISLDQYKDAQADDLNLRNHLITHERVTQERFGTTFDKTAAERAKEERQLDAAGLKRPPPPEPAPPAEKVEDDDGGDDTEKEDAA